MCRYAFNDNRDEQKKRKSYVRCQNFHFFFVWTLMAAVVGDQAATDDIMIVPCCRFVDVAILSWADRRAYSIELSILIEY